MSVKNIHGSIFSYDFQPLAFMSSFAFLAKLKSKTSASCSSRVVLIGWHECSSSQFGQPDLTQS